MIDWILMRVFPYRRTEDQVYDQAFSTTEVSDLARLERRRRAVDWMLKWGMPVLTLPLASVVGCLIPVNIMLAFILFGFGQYGLYCIRLHLLSYRRGLAVGRAFDIADACSRMDAGES